MQAAPRDTVAGRCTANVDRDTGKVYLVGYLDGHEQSATAPHDGGDSQDKDLSRMRDETRQNEYAPGSEPSFPGMQ